MRIAFKMGLVVQWTLLGLQLLPSIFALPSVAPANTGAVSLFPRQDPPIIDVYVDENCRAYCVPETCQFNICPLERRGDEFRYPPRNTAAAEYSHDDDPQHDPDGYRDAGLNHPPPPPPPPPHNSSSSTAVGRAFLAKRAFTTEIVTASQAADYVLKQFPDPSLIPPPPRDQQFPDPPDGFLTKRDTTITYRADFGAQALQWGTGGLHGCTMVFVVSKRAAWMAHIWEIGGFCGRDDKTTYRDPKLGLINCLDNWNNQVINPIFTQAAKRIQPDRFNQDGDNTLVIFMTPRRDFTNEPRYRNKINELVTLINRPDWIPGARVETYLYTPLDYGKAADRTIAATTARGHALFQYDGVRFWRLFYEDMVYHGREGL